MTATPYVTVLMSVYNGGPYLRAAVESIIAQTFTDWEFLIVNDGSTDDTAEQLEAFAQQDSRIVPLHRPKRGTIASVNEGYDLARGHFIARMDADDIAMPTRLEKQLAYLEANPGIELLGGHIRYLTDEGPSHAVLRFEMQPERIYRRILQCNQFCQPTVIFRRDVVRALGGYHPAYLHCEDYDLWLRFAEQYDTANLDEILLNYRVHRKQTSHKFIVQQAIAYQAAQEASRRRRRGLPDPFADSTCITRAGLEAIGISRQSTSRAILDQCAGWIGLQMRLGYTEGADDLRAQLPLLTKESGMLRYVQARLLLEQAMLNVGNGHTFRGCWQAACACLRQPRLFDYAADLLASRIARYGWRAAITN